MAFELGTNIKIVNPSANIDELYGPYNSLTSAYTAIPSSLRVLGKTVGIIEAGIINEYWWKDGIANEDLVLKASAPTFQEVTENGATTDHVIEVEGVKFNELRVTGVISSILGTTGSNPQSMTIDSDGNIYTVNRSSKNVTKITPSGVSSILENTGSNPYTITTDSENNIYILDDSTVITKITPTGEFTTVGLASGSHALITDSDGNIYASNNSDSVTKITPDGVSSVLGTTGNGPWTMTIDSAAMAYVGSIDAKVIAIHLAILFYTYCGLSRSWH